MIKADSLSKAFTATGVIIALYLSTFDLGVLILFPVILLTAGLLMQYYLLGKPSEHPQVYMDLQSTKSIGFYTLVGVAFLFLIGLVAPAVEKLPFLVGVQLTLTQVVLFAALIAIAEEQFFRGFITNFLAKRSVFLGIFGSSVIFAVFHLAVYGTQLTALFYVLSAGILLSWIGIRSGRLSVCMGIHLCNNIFVYALSGVATA